MTEHSSHWLDSVVQSVEEGLNKSCWQPAADIYRTRSGWLVKFDLAGIKEKDISLSVSGRTLSLDGSRRDYTAEQGLSHHRLEICYSHFQRSIELPADLEAAQIRTELCDGMLCVHIDI